MSLRYPTVYKFMRENFSNENSIIVRRDQREQWIKEIRSRIIGLPNISFSTEKPSYPRDDDGFLCSFTIHDPDYPRHSYKYANEFNVRVDARNRLILRGYSETVLLSTLDELVHFIAICNERLDRQVAQRYKRKKIRGLKKQAVVTQVKKFAKAEKFDFTTREDTVKLELIVRLSEKDSLELQIPFNRFEQLLPKLATIIQSALSLYEEGVKFKMEKTPDYRHDSWIKHEEL